MIDPYKWIPPSVDELRALPQAEGVNARALRMMSVITAAASREVFQEIYEIPENLKWLKAIESRIAEDMSDIMDIGWKYAELLSEYSDSSLNSLAEDGELESMLQKMEKDDKLTGGQKGGEGSREFSTLDWDESLEAAEDIPDIGFSEVLQRAKTVEKNLVYGKPKVAIARKYYRKSEHIDFLTEESMCLDDDEFFHNMAEGKLEIDLPLRYEEERQYLLVLLDGSSSMSCGDKVEIVTKILEGLFEQVIQGNSVILLSYFVDTRDEVIVIDNETAVDEFKYFQYRDPNGGSTYIGDILKEIRPKIEAGNIDGVDIPTRTEIVIINDGQDHVDLKEFSIPITAFIVEEENQNLVTLCKNSGGQAYYAANRDFQLL